MTVTPEILKGMDLFEVLEAVELADIAPLCGVEEFASGQYVYREGDKAEKIYMVLEGRVAVEIEIRPGKKVVIYTETKGHMFGYPSLVRLQTFLTSTRCIDKVKVVTIDAEELVSKIFKPDCRRGYLVMNRLAEIIAVKLRETRMQLVSLAHG